MSETDWELKDRRIAWQTITKALAEVQAALIISKCVKFGSLKEAMEDLNYSRTVELASFLVIERKSHRGIGEPTDVVDQEDSSPTSFISPGGLVASPPSPKEHGRFTCEECQVPITDKEKDYSEKWYQKSLCRKHQKEYRERRDAIENANGPRDIGKY